MPIFTCSNALHNTRVYNLHLLRTLEILLLNLLKPIKDDLFSTESTSQDWWFVQKHLTNEKGWVPAVYLRDEPSYTLYVQKKLHEKIDKLPIFESMYLP